MSQQRRRNPLINSAKGGRVLSAVQLPFFLLRPPDGYGILTTTGRKSGKRRRRCVRAVERDGRAYLVAIKGARTGWLRNAEENPDVGLRIRSGSFTGAARVVDPSERDIALEAYCEMRSPFEYLEYSMWRRDRPTRARIRDLHRTWFEQGTPLVVELRP